MTKTEEQLRDALHGIAAATRIPEVRTGEVRTPRVSSWLIPATVAAAVVLVMAIGVAGTSLFRSQERAAAPPSTPGRFFVAGAAYGQGSPGNGVTVRDAATGAITATVPPPKGVAEWIAITATNDETLFYLAGAKPGPAGERLYRLSLTSAGRLRGLDPVNGGKDDGLIRYIAASPDGRRIAYPVDALLKSSRVPIDPKTPVLPIDPRKNAPGHKWGSPPPLKRNGGTWDLHGPIEIVVVDVVTGRREVFKSKETGLLESLSWSADGRRLAYSVGGASGMDGVWVLDTGAGHDLVKASHRVPVQGPLTTPVLSSDGRKLYVIAAQGKDPSWTRVIEVDVATGRRLRVLFEQKYVDNPRNVTWMFTQLDRDATGRFLMAVSDRYAHRIDLSNGQTSRIPFPGGAEPYSFAW
ncbi:PD40 domain-containing protein [Actinomadura rudentiformis]|uniref:WD40 repeat domain-containing protein n=1 Tax=Actinomadura rudentiformis TaxID=359158 RepID=A0A6H9YH06_9ACTN|nr:PD40 domain-containing protein [Actinomadura rudentiformis]KAB2344321.1 hypothetical protein F8566_30715 [Actinomadura rudentiformis]